MNSNVRIKRCLKTPASTHSRAIYVLLHIYWQCLCGNIVEWKSHGRSEGSRLFSSIGGRTDIKAFKWFTIKCYGEEVDKYSVQGKRAVYHRSTEIHIQHSDSGVCDSRSLQFCIIIFLIIESQREFRKLGQRSSSPLCHGSLCHRRFWWQIEVLRS